MKEIGIGVIGYGFIGRVHTFSYLNIPFFYEPLGSRLKLIGVCSSKLKNAQRGIAQAGFGFATDDYKDILDNKDIELVSICTPNYLHKDIVIDAIKADKSIYCEKPLARDLDEAQDMLKAYKNSKKTVQMAFEYRFQPAIMRAKQLVEKGFLGKPLSARIAYLHSGYIDPERPLSWRLDSSASGGGAIYDLGSHIIDLVRYLLGDFKRISAKFDTFFKKRPAGDGSLKQVDVEVDDVAFSMFELENGLTGTMEASRIATGTNDEIRLEIHGDKGSLKFNSMQPNYLYVYDVRDKDTPIGGDRGYKALETVQRYPLPALGFPGPKFSVGWLRYNIASTYDFVKNAIDSKRSEPDIFSGYKVQEVMEAARLSDAKGIWIDLPVNKKG